MQANFIVTFAENYCTVPQKKLTTFEEILSYAASYCAKEERCKSDLAGKLRLRGIDKEQIEACVEQMQERGFLNEERYSQIFVRSKFNQKGWGRIKIMTHLKAKGLPQELINSAVEGVEVEPYSQTILRLYEKKLSLLKDDDPRQRKQKAIRYLLGKGFEYESILRAIKSTGE